MKIYRATEAWRLLNGVFCVYKPSDVSISTLRKMILNNLCRDLNSMQERRQEKMVKILDDPSSPSGLTVVNVPNLADNVLAVGPRYQMQDLKLGWGKILGRHTSGLCVMGVNDANYKLLRLQKSRYISVYQLTGRFGRATDDFHENGRVIGKATYRHVNTVTLDRVLASIQASHQRQMYDHMGFDMQSQDAYEIASSGPIRPAEKTDPLLYGIRCIVFEPPEFVLEVQCINENEIFLMKLIHDIGVTVKSLAVCSKVRQVQFGHFDLKLALLRKHWTLENILNNIGVCHELAKREKLYPKSPNLMTVQPESLIDK